MYTHKLNQRITRAMKETIYLLDAKQISKNNWIFKVQGQSGNTYTVKFNENGTSCSCPDCKTRHHTCKHIIFIIARIAKDNITLSNVTTKLENFTSDRLSRLLVTRLTKRQKEPTASKKASVHCDEDCIICFEEIGSIIESDNNKCSTCGIILHNECIKRWLRQKSSCPHCRSNWQMEIGSRSTDELSKLF